MLLQERRSLLLLALLLPGILAVEYVLPALAGRSGISILWLPVPFLALAALPMALRPRRGSGDVPEDEMSRHVATRATLVAAGSASIVALAYSLAKWTGYRLAGRNVIQINHLVLIGTTTLVSFLGVRALAILVLHRRLRTREG